MQVRQYARSLWDYSIYKQVERRPNEQQSRRPIDNPEPWRGHRLPAFRTIVHRYLTFGQRFSSLAPLPQSRAPTARIISAFPLNPPPGGPRDDHSVRLHRHFLIRVGQRARNRFARVWLPYERLQAAGAALRPRHARPQADNRHAWRRAVRLEVSRQAACATGAGSRADATLGIERPFRGAET